MMLCQMRGYDNGLKAPKSLFHAFRREAIHQEKDEAYYAPVIVTKMRTFDLERLGRSRLFPHLLEVDSSPLWVAVMV